MVDRDSWRWLPHRDVGLRLMYRYLGLGLLHRYLWRRLLDFHIRRGLLHHNVGRPFGLVSLRRGRIDPDQRIMTGLGVLVVLVRANLIDGDPRIRWAPLFQYRYQSIAI
jgi:hypothetical protein